MKKYIDLYHHLSRELYYDIKENKLIDGEDAKALREKINTSGRKIEWKEPDESFKYDIWGNGKAIRLYGNIYEV